MKMTETAWCHQHQTLKAIVKLRKSSLMSRFSQAVVAHVDLACGHSANIVTTPEREARMR